MATLLVAVVMACLGISLLIVSEVIEADIKTQTEFGRGRRELFAIEYLPVLAHDLCFDG